MTNGETLKCHLNERLRWLGHILRMDQDRIPKVALTTVIRMSSLYRPPSLIPGNSNPILYNIYTPTKSVISAESLDPIVMSQSSGLSFLLQYFVLYSMTVLLADRIKTPQNTFGCVF